MIGNNVEEFSFEAYKKAGEDRALRLENRGPFRRTSDGLLDPTILENYWKHGFYVLENVFGEEELSDLDQDINSILNRLPINSNSKFDKEGRLALAACLLYTSPSPRDRTRSRMPSSA